MSSKKPSLVKLVSKTSSIITNDPLHFSTLSALFLLPISFLTILSPFLFPLPSNYTQFLLPIIPSPDSEKTETPPAPKSHLQILLLYTLLVLIFNTCAVSSITRSTISAMHHHPVHLATSLKSIPVSFLPILGTKLVAILIIEFIFIALGLFMGLIFFALSLTFNTDYSSTHFIVLFFVIMALLAAAAIYIGMQWYLAYPIVVLESTWGFSPFKRSSDLVKGARRVVLMTMMLFGIPSVGASMWYTKLAANCELGGWAIVGMVVYGGFATVVLLFSIVADTVLFVYCKELHDQYLPVSRIDDYVKVPLDHEGLMLSTT